MIPLPEISFYYVALFFVCMVPITAIMIDRWYHADIQYAPHLKFYDTHEDCLKLQLDRSKNWRGCIEF